MAIHFMQCIDITVLIYSRFYFTIKQAPSLLIDKYLIVFLADVT